MDASCRTAAPEEALDRSWSPGAFNTD